MEKEKFQAILEKELPEIWKEAVKDRRYLHQYPETGYDTKKTEQWLRQKLQEEKIELLPAPMGVVGVIHGKDSSQMIALRADMDALNLQEENQVPYCSKYPGKMHACGHDGHTAMLLAAIRILSRYQKELPVDVLCIFQPAEEGPFPGGAAYLMDWIEEYGLKDKISWIFGMHLFNHFPVGTLYVRYGAMFASTDEYDITIEGKGGHAGQPQDCIDALSIGAKVVTALESFVSRQIDPFDQVVVSTGIFQAGSAKNIIADCAKMAGTIRCQSEQTRAEVLKNIKQITEGICHAFGASCKVALTHGLPVLTNHKEAVDYALLVAREYLGKENVFMAQYPTMAAEDFSFYSQKIPSAFLWLGSGNSEKGYTCVGHHPKFDFDEEAMKNGITMWCALAMQMKKES